MSIWRKTTLVTTNAFHWYQTGVEVEPHSRATKGVTKSVVHMNDKHWGKLETKNVVIHVSKLMSQKQFTVASISKQTCLVSSLNLFNHGPKLHTSYNHMINIYNAQPHGNTLICISWNLCCSRRNIPEETLKMLFLAETTAPPSPPTLSSVIKSLMWCRKLDFTESRHAVWLVFPRQVISYTCGMGRNWNMFHLQCVFIEMTQYKYSQRLRTKMNSHSIYWSEWERKHRAREITHNHTCTHATHCFVGTSHMDMDKLILINGFR